MATVLGIEGKKLVPTTIAAAGADQAGATLVSSTNCIISGADSAKGVRLPPATVGAIYYLANQEAVNRAVVYPAVGERIYSSAFGDTGVNGIVNVGGNGLGIFTCAVVGTWNAILGQTYAGNNSDWNIGTGALTAKRVQVNVSDTVTATTGGGTTGLIPAGASFVTVTSDNADKQISLPASSIGDEMYILVGATGCELISAVAGHKVNNVVVGATNEAALTATNLYWCRYVATNTWVVVGYTNLGAVQAALVPDAL